MSQSHNQATTVAIGILVVLLLLMALYVAVYLWRWREVRFVMDVSNGWGSTFEVRPRFPTDWEHTVFLPALRVHERLDPAAFEHEGPLEIRTYPTPF
jgi:hypothetical protein